jgi:hypothetical protein
LTEKREIRTTARSFDRRESGKGVLGPMAALGIMPLREVCQGRFGPAPERSAVILQALARLEVAIALPQPGQERQGILFGALAAVATQRVVPRQPLQPAPLDLPDQPAFQPALGRRSIPPRSAIYHDVITFRLDGVNMKEIKTRGGTTRLTGDGPRA